MSEMCERKVDISVIIPVYNLENYLSPMLSSLKAQNLGEYTAEYIFILNNCTDRSEEVIKESGLECTILSCEKQGCGHARNTGLEYATGEYVWFMDGDDWLLDDNAIHNVLLAAKELDLDILRIVFTSNGFYMHYFSMVWQYLLRREYINEFRFTGRQPGEDDEFMFWVLYKADLSPATYLQLPYYRKPLYFYNYLREGSNMYRHFHGEDINGDL